MDFLTIIKEMEVISIYQKKIHQICIMHVQLIQKEILSLQV